MTQMNYLLNQLFGNSEQFEWKVIERLPAFLNIIIWI